MSKLGSHQLRQAREKSWGLSPVTGPDNWRNILHEAPSTLPFFFFTPLVPFPSSCSVAESGCLWEGGNTLPYPMSQGLPCGLGLTRHFSLPGFHYASHDTSSSHDIERYKYGRFPKRSRKGRHSNSHSSGGCTPSLSPVAQKQGDHCLQTKE